SSRAWNRASTPCCDRISTLARWALPATARSWSATPRSWRSRTGWRSMRRWPTTTATATRSTARSRWPTAIRSGRRRSARCSRASGSPARAPAGGTSRAGPGSRSRAATPRSVGARGLRSGASATIAPPQPAPTDVARIDQTPFELDIIDLSHDGRGVARREGGKTVFVADALPGERVLVRQTARSRSFDEATTLEVLQASPDRGVPRCAHFGVCSGCVLQHLDESRQILAKQRVLLENFERIGHVAPGAVLPPLTGGAWRYRRKGRFSVRRVEKKDRTLVGFRERDPRFVADLRECHTVVPEVAALIVPLSALVDGLQARREVPQIEFIVGDPEPEFDGAALVFRHLQPLGEADLAALRQFGQRHRVAIHLQPRGVDSVHALWPERPRHAFRLDPWGITLSFRPLDFIQVNARLNEVMIARALELLDLRPGERKIGRAHV